MFFYFRYYIINITYVENKVKKGIGYMLKYGIIGMGGLGKLHLSNLDMIGKERGDICLKAICGATKEELKKSVGLNIGTVDVSKVNVDDCNFYQDYKEMLANEELDFVVAAVPTYLHEEVAIYTLEHGVNILSEKPMALTLEGCDRMIDAMHKSGKLLMIGHCMRFYSTYAKLKELVETGIYGKVYRAEFTRYSQMPKWTWNNWILDPAMSGGCPLDLHVHDVDMMNYLFGTPKSLFSTATSKKVELESIFTQYYYDDGMVVISGADWSLPDTYKFNAQCMVNFEKAAAVIIDDKLSIYTDEEVITPELSDESEFVCELNAFIDMVKTGAKSKVTSPESIRETVRIIKAEVESAKTRKIIEL